MLRWHRPHRRDAARRADVVALLARTPMPTSTALAMAPSTSPATPNMTGSTARTPPAAATITHSVAKAVRMTPSEKKLRAAITKKVPRAAKALAKLSLATGRAEVLMMYVDRAKRRPIGGRASAKAKKNRRAKPLDSSGRFAPRTFKARRSRKHRHCPASAL